MKLFFAIITLSTTANVFAYGSYYNYNYSNKSYYNHRSYSSQVGVSDPLSSTAVLLAITASIEVSNSAQQNYKKTIALKIINDYAQYEVSNILGESLALEVNNIQSQDPEVTLDEALDQVITVARSSVLEK